MHALLLHLSMHKKAISGLAYGDAKSEMAFLMLKQLRFRIQCIVDAHQQIL